MADKPAEQPSGSGRGDDFGWSVAVFFVTLAGVLLVIHFLQPEGRETVTSSRSPMHQQAD